jgi:hypothetical protein
MAQANSEPVVGGHQGQQFVGDVLIVDRGAVVVAGIQQFRQYVGAAFGGRVGPRVGDE